MEETKCLKILSKYVTLLAEQSANWKVRIPKLHTSNYICSTSNSATILQHKYLFVHYFRKKIVKVTPVDSSSRNGVENTEQIKEVKDFSHNLKGFGYKQSVWAPLVFK